MPSIFGHAIAGVALSKIILPKQNSLSVRFWSVVCLCASIPDADVLGYYLGVPYDHWLGHRGFSHSLIAAAVIAAIGALFLKKEGPEKVQTRSRLWLCLFLVTASHGILDGLTDGGHGVAFFSPFCNDRYFFPWHPIPVSPLSIRRFISLHGLSIFVQELFWIGVPGFLAANLVRVVARRRSAGSA